MKKLWCTLLAVAFVAATEVRAVSVLVRQPSPGYGGGNGGGEFNISPNFTGASYGPEVAIFGGFETFCVQANVGIIVPGTYDAAVGQADSVGNPLTVGAAWLYQLYASENPVLVYNYTPGVPRTGSANELQQAIWILQGQGGGNVVETATTSAYVQQAATHFGSLANALVPNNGTFPVAIVQMTDTNGIPVQDMLSLTSPTVSCAAASGLVGSFYSSSLVATGGCLPYTFSILSGALPPGLTLNPNTGAITGTPTNAGTFNYVAQVTDSCGSKADTSSQHCGITITPCNGQIGDFVWNDLNGNGCQDLGEPGIVGVKVDLYAGCGVGGTPITTTTTDGSGKYNFSGLCPGTYTVSFTTPAGYARTVANAGCTVNGNPPYSNQTDSKCSLCAAGTPCGVCVILGAANPINLNVDCGYVILPGANCVTITAVQGTPITPVTMVGSGGCGGPYTFTATNLPSGLTMSSGGTISGTPTVNGTSNYSVTVTDKCGNKGTVNCSVTVKPPLTLTCVGGSGQVGVPFSASLLASNGVPPYAYSIVSGSLPPGLTLNPNKGVISGTPTSAGSFCFTAKVTDAAGATATSVCSSGCAANSLVTWLFSAPSGTLGTSQTYTLNGLTITAYGYTKANAPTALYGKNAGGNENGVGIASDSDFEINTNTYVQLDLKQLIDGGAQNAMMIIGSVQSGEGYSIYGSAVQGSLGALLVSGTTDSTPFLIPNYPNNRYVSVTASAANVLLGAVAASLPCGCTITIAPPPCLTTLSGTIFGDCDPCVRQDKDHDDRDHDGKDHSKCNHKYNECTQDGKDHSGCRHERGWCNQDGKDHSKCDHANGVCKVDTRDHSLCDHRHNICVQDGHRHAECDHLHGVCKDDGRDHSTCNHKYNECSLDGKDHSGCRHERGWCNQDGKDHSRCDHAHGVCKVDQRDHSQCDHAHNICLQDGHDHSNCDHAHIQCKFSPGQCGLAGFTVQLKNAAGTSVLATQVTGTNGTYQFTGLNNGTYLVVVLPQLNYVEFFDLDGVLDNMTSVTLSNCVAKAGVDFGYKRSANCVTSIAGTIYGFCDLCVRSDKDHDDRDHDGKDHSKCNHKFNECTQDGKDHSGCRHERGWCNQDGKDHSRCDHARGYCRVDKRDHSLCDHRHNICVQDGYNHAECDHAHGICSHDGKDHSKCNHKYGECTQDGKDHSGCRHERGWCNQDGKDHSKCDHANGICKVDRRDHSQCDHSRNICVQDGHDHSGCDHAHRGCKYAAEAAQCGLQGFTVQLKNSAGNVLASQITPANGAYLFSGLSAGTYSVVVVPLTGYTQFGDPDGTLDNKSSVTLASCQSKTCVNFGYKATTSSSGGGGTGGNSGDDSGGDSGGNNQQTGND